MPRRKWSPLPARKGRAMHDQVEVPALGAERKDRADKVMERFRELLTAEGIALTAQWDQVFVLFAGAADEFPPQDDQG